MCEDVAGRAVADVGFVGGVAFDAGAFRVAEGAACARAVGVVGAGDAVSAGVALGVVGVGTVVVAEALDAGVGLGVAEEVA